MEVAMMLITLYVPIKAKGIIARVFNKITSLNKAKTFENIFYYILNSTHVI